MRTRSILVTAVALTLSSAVSALAGGQPTVVDTELQHAYLDARTGEVTFSEPKPSNSVAPGPIFSALAGPYAAFAVSTQLGFDDYNSIVDYSLEPVVPLYEMSFVGGVTAAGMSLQFDFFTPSNLTTPYSTFSSTFGTAGNYIWTVTNVGIDIPSDGVIDVNGVTTADTGLFFLGTTAPSIGTQDPVFTDVSGSTAYSHRFELVVPEPASLSAIALALPLFIRRRKA
jgi:hypothetical protein